MPFIVLFFVLLEMQPFQLNKPFSFLFISVCVLIFFFYFYSLLISFHIFCLNRPRNKTNNNFGLCLYEQRNNLNVMNTLDTFASFYAINCCLTDILPLLEMQIKIWFKKIDFSGAMCSFYFFFAIYTLFSTSFGPLPSLWIDKHLWKLNQFSMHSVILRRSFISWKESLSHWSVFAMSSSSFLVMSSEQISWGVPIVSLIFHVLFVFALVPAILCKWKKIELNARLQYCVCEEVKTIAFASFIWTYIRHKYNGSELLFVVFAVTNQSQYISRFLIFYANFLLETPL